MPSPYNVRTMYVQKIYKSGNSVVVTIPKQFLKEAGLRDGSPVEVGFREGVVLIKRRGKKSTIFGEISGLTPEFKEWLDEASVAHEGLIKKLAKK